MTENTVDDRWFNTLLQNEHSKSFLISLGITIIIALFLFVLPIKDLFTPSNAESLIENFIILMILLPILFVLYQKVRGLIGK
ncbi:MAG: hypothetical protein ACW99F_01460 [Candidatus Hodarchaeales archaeon]